VTGPANPAWETVILPAREFKSSRDVGKAAEFSNWPEPAGATQKESNELGRNLHSCKSAT